MMTLNEVYAGVVKKLDYLSVVTGARWDLLWSEKEFGYQIVRGSKIVHRALWIRQVYEQITREVDMHNKKNGRDQVAQKCDCVKSRRLHASVNVSVKPD